MRALTFSLCVLLAACGSDDNDPTAKSAAQLETERLERQLDEQISIEAQRILSSGQFFYGFARQPEVEPDLKQLLADYTTPLPDLKASKDCRLVAARAYIYGQIIENSARQPELVDNFHQHFTEHAGALTPNDITDCEEARYMRSFAVAKLFEAVFRQPELADNFRARAATVIGNYSDIQPTEAESELVLAGAIQAQGKAIEGWARQPEMQNDSDIIGQINQQFLPPVADFKAADNCLANKARLYAAGYYIEGAARQPEMFICPDGSCSEYYITDMPQRLIGAMTPAADIGACALPVSTHQD